MLFDELSLPGGKKGKTGAYGTDASILEELALTHDLPARVLDWRQLTKLKSTYTDALIEEINPETGRVHTTYALARRRPGGSSSNDPNLQNIPIRTEEGRKIRRAFVAEPGHLLISADYSQIELRLAAHVAEIAALKEAFLAGADIHALTASEVFGVPIAEMDAPTRAAAPRRSISASSTASAPSASAQQIGVPQGEAADYIKAYFERFPGIRDYMERMKASARDKGYVETLFGRRCHIPGIRTPTRRAAPAPSARRSTRRCKARRRHHQARDDPHSRRRSTAAGLKARMLLQVHDELVFEAPEAEVEATAALVKEVMEGACAPRCELSVPLVVETGMGPQLGRGALRAAETSHKKTAGREARPSNFSLPEGRMRNQLRRVPSNCISNMNRLMKSR